jgi:hypothetical protein
MKFANKKTNNRKENHMMYLGIIFIPPAYFIARRQWGGLALNGILYFIACCCVVTFVGIPLGILFWTLSVGHAGFTYRKELLTYHAELIATKMAEKLQNQPPKPQ